MGKSISVNRDDEAVWCFTAFTRGGAYVLAKRYRDKLGCTILEEPMERDDGMWVFMVTNPFMDAAASCNHEGGGVLYKTGLLQFLRDLLKDCYTSLFHIRRAYDEHTISSEEPPRTAKTPVAFHQLFSKKIREKIFTSETLLLSISKKYLDFYSEHSIITYVVMMIQRDTRV